MNKTLSLHLRKLNCYRPDESDADEVFIMLNGKKIWPAKRSYVPMKGGAEELNVRIKDLEVNSIANIELWDYDLFSANDLLGSFRLVVDKSGGPYNTDLTVNKSENIQAKYNLEWEILS
jgi:hypothetical protein